MTIALAATLHDPSGALVPEIRRWLPILQRRYSAVCVTTSPPTAPRVRDLLAVCGGHAGTPATNTRGPLYRLALRRALASGAARVHYLDLDRALHWMAQAPRELEALLQLAVRQSVLLIGRTPAAHRSHHQPLYVTESEANARFAVRLGLRGRIDFLVPSFVLDRAATRRLLGRSRARDVAMYGEWVGLIPTLARDLAYVECRGLDWETPDRHRRAVVRVGLAAWRRRHETPSEWRRRTEMAKAFARGFAAALERWPPGTVRLRRLSLRGSGTQVARRRAQASQT